MRPGRNGRGPVGPGHPVGPPREGSAFGRAVVAMVLEEIAARLARIGVIGGSAIDAGHVVGALPPGVSRLLVQHDGVDVAATGTLNFVGAAFVVTHDAALGRVDVALAGGGPAPDVVTDRTGMAVTARTGGEDVLTRAA